MRRRGWATIVTAACVVLLSGCATANVSQSGAAASSVPTPIATATPTAAALQASPETEDAAAPLLVTIGNSYVGGSSMDSGASYRWPALVGAADDVAVEVLAAGSSGYVTPGDDDLTFEDLAEQVPSDATVVLVMGSDNDAGVPEDEIYASAVRTLELVKRRAPDAVLVVASTPWVDPDPDEDIVATRDAVERAAKRVGGIFLDSLAEGWLVTGPEGQIAADGLHPTDLGHEQLAEAIAPVVASALGR